MKYYKVLVNNESCHGGKHIWSLPNLVEVPDMKPAWTSGEWSVIEGKILLCQRGFHVTTNPSLWWKDGCSVYEAEISGEIGGEDAVKAKVVASCVRLLHPVKMIKIDNGWQIEQDETKSSGWSDPVKA